MIRFMFRLIETIKLKDGFFGNMDIHNERFNNSRESLFQIKEHIDLLDYLKLHEFNKSGLYKCRILYNQNIKSIEFIPYIVRKVRNLKLIYADIDYKYKYEDRTNINKLLELRENCDDVLIVKNNRLTDTSAANIAFFDNNKWYTPLCPLLKGTEREKLLRDRIIFEDDLKISDLKRFYKIALFSSMLDFGEVVISLSNILISY